MATSLLELRICQKKKLQLASGEAHIHRNCLFRYETSILCRSSRLSGKTYGDTALHCKCWPVVVPRQAGLKSRPLQSAQLGSPMTQPGCDQRGAWPPPRSRCSRLPVSRAPAPMPTSLPTSRPDFSTLWLAAQPRARNGRLFSVRHCAELPLLFGGLKYSYNAPEEEYALSKTMRAAWRRMAALGSP